MQQQALGSWSPATVSGSYKVNFSSLHFPVDFTWHLLGWAALCHHQHFCRRSSLGMRTWRSQDLCPVHPEIHKHHVNWWNTKPKLLLNLSHLLNSFTWNNRREFVLNREDLKTMQMLTENVVCRCSIWLHFELLNSLVLNQQCLCCQTKKLCNYLGYISLLSFTLQDTFPWIYPFRRTIKCVVATHAAQLLFLVM